MAETQESLVEERVEFMVSPSGGDPTLRIAHFLKPCATSSNAPVVELPPPHCLSASTSGAISQPRKLPFKVAFHGWRFPQRKWKSWVDRMHPLHQSTWKKARIYESIMGSTCEIRRDDALIFELAERWCSDTNTFIFPWGEATVTLEDMMVLGGYSVLGDPVTAPLQTLESKRIQQELIEARKNMGTSSAHKASQSLWIAHFMEEEEIEFEHEAFLSLWLSRFALPGNPHSVILKYAFPMAIHLARGTPLALAPAILTSIYRDLSLLKVNLDAFPEMKNAGNVNAALVLTLWAPLQLVQIWAWERFPTLRPDPNPIQPSEPRWARWNSMKPKRLENVGSALDSAMDSFQWRPYVAGSLYKSTLLPKLYREKEEWVGIDDSDEALQSLARCFRVSELVGLDCIQQYLPNRVAMQFGLDQDIPVGVARSNATSEMAWGCYSRPVGDALLYVPARLIESDVTTRYLEWWSRSSSHEGMNDYLRTSPQPLNGNKVRNHTSVPLGFTSKVVEAELQYSMEGYPAKFGRFELVDSSDEDRLTITELLRSQKKRRRIGNGQAADVRLRSPSSSSADLRVAKKATPAMETLGNTVRSKSRTGNIKKSVVESLHDDGSGEVTILSKTPKDGLDCAMGHGKMNSMESLDNNGSEEITVLSKPPKGGLDCATGDEKMNAMESLDNDGNEEITTTWSKPAMKKSPNSCADNGRKLDSSTKQSSFSGAASKLELEPPIEQPPCKEEEETVQVDDTVRHLERQYSSVGAFETGVFVNATESRKEKTVICGTGSHEILGLGLELEARIDKLEKVIAWLKAGRHRNA